MKLQPLKKQYLEFLRQTRNNPEINNYMAEDVNISRKDQEKWHKDYLKRNDIKVFIAFAGAIPVGYSQIRNIDKKNRFCELVFCIAPGFQGRGYGKELCKKIMDYASKKLKMHRIWLEVLDFNKRAIQLYQKRGFKIEGVLRDKIFKKGKYHNAIIMSIIKNR